MASKITYILVHQARLSDTTVTQDYNLEKEKRKRQLDNNIPPVTLHAKKKPHTFNKTFLREDMAVNGCRTAALYITTKQ